MTERYSPEWEVWVNEALPDNFLFESFPESAWAEKYDEKGNKAVRKYFVFRVKNGIRYPGALLTALDNGTIRVQTSAMIAFNRDYRDIPQNEIVKYVRSAVYEVMKFEKDRKTRG